MKCALCGDNTHTMYTGHPYTRRENWTKMRGGSNRISEVVLSTMYCVLLCSHVFDGNLCKSATRVWRSQKNRTRRRGGGTILELTLFRSSYNNYYYWRLGVLQRVPTCTTHDNGPWRRKIRPLSALFLPFIFFMVRWWLRPGPREYIKRKSLFDKSMIRSTQEFRYFFGAIRDEDLSFLFYIKNPLYLSTFSEYFFVRQ